MQNFSIGFVEEGLHDRAITRDLEWGVPHPRRRSRPRQAHLRLVRGRHGLPLRLEGVVAAARRSRRRGARWWEDPDALTYYFIGKDNISVPHDHLAGASSWRYGGLNLPTDVPANQYVTFKGEKASKSEGVGDSVLDYLERYQPDAIRYCLAANLPENSDTDLTEAETDPPQQRRARRHVGQPREPRAGDDAHELRRQRAAARGRSTRATRRSSTARSRDARRRRAPIIEAVHLKAALAHGDVPRAGGERLPQRDRSPGRRRRPTWSARARPSTSALCAINALKVALYPFLPFSSQSIHEYLGPQRRDRGRRLGGASAGARHAPAAAGAAVQEDRAAGCRRGGAPFGVDDAP